MAKNTNENRRETLAPLFLEEILSANRGVKYTTEELCMILKSEYDICLDRKAVTRYMNTLSDEYFMDIHHDRTGNWME